MLVEMRGPDGESTTISLPVVDGKLNLTELLAAGGPEGAIQLLQQIMPQLTSSGGFSSSASSSEDEESVAPVLESQDLEGLVAYIAKSQPKSVICMLGAGLSTAAGIPDFRSPGTGLYDNLQRYNLPEPQAVFDLNFFRERPQAFYDLAKELWPTGEKYRPTKSHYFIKMLEEKGILLRCYTQNIDMLEQLAGISSEKIIAAHGNFAKAHTLKGVEVPVKELEEAVFSGVDACLALADKYGALAKPDIVFFGESLPEAFHDGILEDFPQCDLLLVMGTSLAVAPFNQLIRRVPKHCPRVLVNREAVGLDSGGGVGGTIYGGFRFTPPAPASRDVFLEGDLDIRVAELSRQLGWEETLNMLQEKAESQWQVACKTTEQRATMENAKPDAEGGDGQGSQPSSSGARKSRSRSRSSEAPDPKLQQGKKTLAERSRSRSASERSASSASLQRTKSPTTSKRPPRKAVAPPSNRSRSCQRRHRSESATRSRSPRRPNFCRRTHREHRSNRRHHHRGHRHRAPRPRSRSRRRERGRRRHHRDRRRRRRRDSVSQDDSGSRSASRPTRQARARCTSRDSSRDRSLSKRPVKRRR